MPLPNNPNLPEFYVYRLEFREIPFYVGIGRAARASDRVRWVKRCMAREEENKPVKWALHCAVMAQLLREGHEINVAYVVRDVVRTEALTHERSEINRLLAEDAVLANLQHNSKRPSSAAQVLEAIRERLEAVAAAQV